jgi:methylornithine synthase
MNRENRLQEVLSKALGGQGPGDDEIRFLLSLKGVAEIGELFAAARHLRHRYFGGGIFLYGFIYFNTFCRKDCLFCYYRRSNTSSRRYRKTAPGILETAARMVAAGVHLIDLTMGEAPEFHHRGSEGFGKLVELAASVKRAAGTPVMISPGVLPDSVIGELAASGTDWYACYQETHNRELFGRLRVGQDFDERMGKKHLAKKQGLLIEEGILTGIGDSSEDISRSIAEMRNMDADQVRVMSFVPQRGTPMANLAGPEEMRELLIIAVLRLVFPDRLIPGSLDVDGLGGLKKRLDAGANVVTSLVFPESGFAGVANSDLDIQEGRRTPEAVAPVLEECGLRAATLEEYIGWIGQRRASQEGQIAC